MTDTDENRLLTVGCPHCSSRYRLPLPLMGPGGARIHCPTCWESFVVSLDGVSSPEFDEATETRFPTPGPPSEEPAEPTIPALDPEPGSDHSMSEEVVARAVVEDLIPHAGSMREAQACGRLLAEAGPLLLEAFDLYRRRAGTGAGIAAFHDALSASLGIELPFALESGLPKRGAGAEREPQRG